MALDLGRQQGRRKNGEKWESGQGSSKVLGDGLDEMESCGVERKLLYMIDRIQSNPILLLMIRGNLGLCQIKTPGNKFCFSVARDRYAAWQE